VWLRKSRKGPLWPRPLAAVAVLASTGSQSGCIVVVGQSSGEQQHGGGGAGGVAGGVRKQSSGEQHGGGGARVEDHACVAGGGLPSQHQAFRRRRRRRRLQQPEHNQDRLYDIFGGLHNIHRSNIRSSGDRWIQGKYDDGIRGLPALVLYMYHKKRFIFIKIMKGRIFQ